LDKNNRPINVLTGQTFPEKEARSVVLLYKRQLDAQTSAKPTQGVWGRAPKTIWSTNILTGQMVFTLSGKEAKSVLLLCGRLQATHTLAKPIQGVWEYVNRMFACAIGCKL
jgi:hypothetical protein